MIFSIAKDFTDTPGLRYKHQSEFSGELFREEHLRRLLKTYQETKEPIIIDLDGVFGYPTSFLEEAFGGLAREFSEAEVMKAFTFVSTEQPDIIDEIKEDILMANKERK